MEKSRQAQHLLKSNKAEIFVIDPTILFNEWVDSGLLVSGGYWSMALCCLSKQWHPSGPSLPRKHSCCT
jgi:hypothetical protein